MQVHEREGIFQRWPRFSPCPHEGMGVYAPAQDRHFEILIAAVVVQEGQVARDEDGFQNKRPLQNIAV